MKSSRLLILTGFAAGIIVLGWQTCTIMKLRAEVASLRRDLRTSLESALDRLESPSSEADRERREKLELIRLRHQVRELNESTVDWVKEIHAGRIPDFGASLLH